MEVFFSTILTVLATYWIWIPILLVTSPIWGLALYGFFSKPLEKDKDE